MAKLLLAVLVLTLHLSWCRCDETRGTENGGEEWGYIDVREGAHMFWWLYYKDGSSNFTESVPLILWLQGGPGASGAGYGNFEEIGPLFTNLEERESTWVNVAHVLFVDNPVGTGFSYVDNSELLTTTNRQVSDDLISFLKKFFDIHEELRASPFYIVAESYGGKYACEVGVAIVKEGLIDFNFQGISLGNSWISPLDYLFAWGPLLRSVSLIDDVGNDLLRRIAEKAKAELGEGGDKIQATNEFVALEIKVLMLTKDVDFYNFLKHESDDDADSSLSFSRLNGSLPLHLQKTASQDPLETLMNGIIRKKLEIVPENVRWTESSESVFKALSADFMLDTISVVRDLLETGTKVNIYSGQLDLICCTTGTLKWLQKMEWSLLDKFNKARRTPLYCGDDPYKENGQPQAFVKKYENLAFYWILNAGHMVPADNPCAATMLLKQITGESVNRENGADWNILNAEVKQIV